MLPWSPAYQSKSTLKDITCRWPRKIRVRGCATWFRLRWHGGPGKTGTTGWKAEGARKIQFPRLSSIRVQISKRLKALPLQVKSAGPTFLSRTSPSRAPFLRRMTSAQHAHSLVALSPSVDRHHILFRGVNKQQPRSSDEAVAVEGLKDGGQAVEG